MVRLMKGILQKVILAAVVMSITDKNIDCHIEFMKVKFDFIE